MITVQNDKKFYIEHALSNIRFINFLQSIRSIKIIQSFLVLLAMLMLAACSDPNAERRAYLLTEIKQIENNYSLVSHELQTKMTNQAQLEQQLLVQQSELAQFKQRVEAFILNHKMAVAALAAGAGGAAVAYDQNNEFSEDVRNTASLVSIVAALYAIGNFEEVSNVADQLMQASRRVENMKSQIQTTKTRLSYTYKPVSDLQTNLNSMQAEYNKYKTELASLRG